MIVVRPLSVADRPTHVTLRQQLWPGPVSEHQEELAAVSERATFHAVGAWDGEGPDARAVGFAEATLREYVDGTPASPAGTAYLEGIWVAPCVRRSGVASRLLAAVEAWARSRGCRHLGSDADLDNPASHRWHRGTGFAEVGQTVNFAKPLDAAGG